MIPTMCSVKRPKIMLIGEAPGVKEVAAGKPFAAGSGVILRKMLTQAGIFYGDCAVGNVSSRRLKTFYVDKYNTPTPEFKIELNRLRNDILLYKPNVIVAMGVQAMIALTGEKKIKTFQGTILDCILVPGTKVLVTQHPRIINYEWTMFYQTVLYLRKAAYEAENKGFIPDPRKFVIAPRKTEIISYLEFLYDNRKTLKIAIDLEHLTPGAHVSWVGISHDKNYAMSIQLMNVKDRAPCFPERDEAEIWYHIARVCAHLPIIIHNAGYDAINLWHNYNIKCENIIFDTLLAAHVLWPEFPRDLGFLSSICLNVPAWKHTSGTAFSHGEYNAADVANTRGLYDVLKTKINSDECYSKTFANEMSQIELIGFMQLQGMYINPTTRDELREKFDKKIREIENGLNQLLNKQINFNSNKQLANLLYVDLALPTQYKKRAPGDTKRKVTVDAEALKKIYSLVKHPILKLILEQRKAVKALQFINVNTSPTGMVHTSYNQAGTTTGRYSSSKSIILDYGSGNLQNIDKRIRVMYTPPPIMVYNRTGKKVPLKLLQADYKGAEAHYVAHEIQDHTLMRAFDEGKDVHNTTAVKLFGCDYDNVPKDQRNKAKTVRHGVNYCAGPGVIVKRIGCTMAEAKKLLADFYNTTPQLKIWHQKLQDQLHKDRTLITPFDRKRVFMGRWGDTLFRAATAFKPQSTIGDLLNKALVAFYEKHKEEKYMSIALQLHDAIYIFYPEGDELYWAKQLYNAMHIPIKLPHRDLYIGIDFKVGDNWGEMNGLEVNFDEKIAG